jgi:hypothetical protein
VLAQLGAADGSKTAEAVKAAADQVATRGKKVE